MRATLVAVLVIASASLVSCRHRVVVVEHDVAYNEGPREEIVVTEAPPATRVEIIPVAPSVNHVWIAGYWTHRGGSWVWVAGCHVLRPRVHAVWVPGHWERHPRGSVRVHGHWR